MRTRNLLRLLMATTILLLVIPMTASAQSYQRGYDRLDRRDVRDAVNQLNNSSNQLERDLNAGRQRRILGGVFSYSSVDSTAVAEVREFRRAVAELRQSVRSDFSLDSSRDEARAVIDRGIQLDRYLRLRTGSASVDADLASIRSNLHVLAETYGINRRY